MGSETRSLQSDTASARGVGYSLINWVTVRERATCSSVDYTPLLPVVWLLYPVIVCWFPCVSAGHLCQCFVSHCFYMPLCSVIPNRTRIFVTFCHYKVFTKCIELLGTLTQVRIWIISDARARTDCASITRNLCINKGLYLVCCYAHNFSIFSCKYFELTIKK